MTSVAIIGAGIIGITSALCLLKDPQFEVTIYTEHHPLETNSDEAVAMWYVPEQDRPQLQILCLESLPKFQALSQIPGSGVEIIPIVYYYKDQLDFKNSIWSNPVLGKQIQLTTDIPDGYAKNEDFKMRVLAQVPLMDVPIYRVYLLTQFYSLKGKLRREKVLSLSTLAEEYDIVINCAGWGAQNLVRDERIYPVRGQVEIFKLNKVPVERPRSIYVREKEGYVMYRPLTNVLLVGTTYQIKDKTPTPREEDKLAILEKMKPFIESHTARHLSEGSVSRVGIRCGASDVLIYKESSNITSGSMKKKSLLVHCYGHSGCGFSSSWASAARVLNYCLEYQKMNQSPLKSKL